MLMRTTKDRPDDWRTLRAGVKHGWVVPFVAFEWVWEWVAYLLSHWRFLEVLEYLSSLSVLVGVIFYFSESGDRIMQRHYQAWQVINTAQGKGGSGGRIEALQELNLDHVSLVGVDVSGAFLQRVGLSHALLTRANLSAVDARDSDLRVAMLEDADLESANFRGANLTGVSFAGASLGHADLVCSDLEGADLERADLTDVDLRRTNLAGIQWQKIAKIQGANLGGVRNAPPGFVAWALQQGAVQENADGE